MARASIGIGLMCKPPWPGSSKTRLASSIGCDAAARLSEAFLRDCAGTIMQAAERVSLRYAAYFRPSHAEPDIRAVLGSNWPLEHADEGDLGATMQSVFARLLAQCPDGALIMGADVPMMAAEELATAAEHLMTGTRSTLVLSPSSDGGYCLIGAKSLAGVSSLLAEMKWSTPDVLGETLTRAGRAQLCVKLLSEQRDIDDAHDLAWLRWALTKSAIHAPVTRRVIAELFPS